MKQKELGLIKENRIMAPGIFEMLIEAQGVAEHARPGQFLNLYCGSHHLLLPRPISICEIFQERKEIRLIYGVVGKGTKALSQLRPGMTISFMGPLGKGFELWNVKRHLVVGGGIGVPPLLELVKQLRGEVTVVLGFRHEGMLIKEFEALGARVLVATEDGSQGIKGTVTDILRTIDLSKTEMVYSCGPRGMLRAVAQWAQEKQIPAQLSFEERMACGIGACLVCTCKIQQSSQVDWENMRVCKDGPVFWREEVIWE